MEYVNAKEQKHRRLFPAKNHNQLERWASLTEEKTNKKKTRIDALKQKDYDTLES
jgi:hypothetical protein